MSFTSTQFEDTVKHHLVLIEEQRARAHEFQNTIIPELKRQSAKLIFPYQIHEKRYLERKIAALQSNADAVLNGHLDREYEEYILPYITAFHKEGILQQMRTTLESVRGETTDWEEALFEEGERSIQEFPEEKQLISYKYEINLNADEFDEFMEGRNKIVPVELRQICPVCQIDLRHNVNRGVLYCEKCQRQSKHLDATSLSMPYGEEVECVHYTYQTINHFNEWLLFIQALESYVVPDEHIEALAKYMLVVEGITKKEDITLDMVHKGIKVLQLGQYDHKVQIWCRLTGRQPERMTPVQQELIRLCFILIQQPYLKHKPPNRQNFMSYSFVMYKFCQLLSFDNFKKCCTLLRGAKKLKVQDELFEKICIDLNWPFIPTLPEKK